MYAKKSFSEKTKKEFLPTLEEMGANIEGIEDMLLNFGNLVKDEELDSWYASYIWLLQTENYSFWIEYSDWRFEVKIRRGKASAKEFIGDYENNFKYIKYTNFVKFNDAEADYDLKSKLEAILSLLGEGFLET